MEELKEKVRHLSRWRIEYFLVNPTASREEFIRDLKAQITKLIQEIPIAPGQTASTEYFKGRILNQNVDYDAHAEEALSLALRLDSENVDGWIELGKCFWKKPDIDRAISCFQKKDPRALCYYATALRIRASTTSDEKERLRLIKQCMTLCRMVTAIAPTYAFGWYCLANTHFLSFFVTAQKKPEDLNSAIEEYKKALECTDPKFVNADLHVNYAEALTYKQDYEAALGHLNQSIKIEPHFQTALDRKEALLSFLSRLDNCIKRKGNLSAKRLKEFVNSTNSKFYGKYGLPESKFVHSNVFDLQVGPNQGAFICAKVVSIASFAKQVPLTAIAVDCKGDIFALCFYNVSENFTSLISDVFTIPSPFVIDISNLHFDDKTLNVRLIRISIPLGIYRNGTLLNSNCGALTTAVFTNETA